MQAEHINWIQLIWTMGGFFISMVGGTIAVTWQFRGSIEEFRRNMKADYDSRFLMFEKDYDSKIGRAYERFDQHKKFSDDKFVCKELCNVMHNSTAAQLTETNMRLTNMETKIDRLVERIGK